MKKLILPLITVAAFSIMSCGDETLLSEYNIVTATKSKSWSYRADNPICELDPSIKSVNITNMPVGKNLYFVKRNTGSATISFSDTRIVSNQLSSSNRAVLSEENFPDIVVPDEDQQFFRRHYKTPKLPELKTSFRSASSPELKTEPAEIEYFVGDTKKIYVDDNPEITTFSKATATLRAKGNDCYVWVVDNYYSETASGNKVNTSAAEKVADSFDKMYPLITKIFGLESTSIIDLDAYGFGDIDCYSDTGEKINIVIYDIANDYSKTSVSTSGVMGYFNAKDFYFTEQNTSSIIGKSNVGKYFYIDSACLNYYFEETISTLAHEFQHMINFSQKDMRFMAEREQRSSPSVAYNEMLSMLCEDMMQEHLNLKDWFSPKIRIQTFNGLYFYSGITEYRSTDYTTSSYANSYAFGSWLCRQYGGAALVTEIMENDEVDNASLVAAVNELNSKNYTFDDLFKQFLLAITKNSTYTHNQDAKPYPITDPLTESSYQYPMKAFNIFSSAVSEYKRNNVTYRFTYSLRDSVIREALSDVAASTYDWNGPVIFKATYGLKELRPENGITIHHVEKITETSKTYNLTEQGADTLKLYLIIQ